MTDQTDATTTTADSTTSQGTPTQQPAKKEPKFDQDDMNAVAGNARKEGADAARKALLKELGIENIDDPKALESVKGKLTAAEKAEAEKLSEVEKAIKRAEKAEAEAVENAAKIAELAAARIADRVDSKLKDAAHGAKALKAENVVKWLRMEKKSAVEKLVSEDGEIDDKAVEKLIADFKKEEPEWFAKATGVGSPSVSGGRSIQPDDKAEAIARRNSQRIIRG